MDNEGDRDPSPGRDFFRVGSTEWIAWTIVLLGGNSDSRPDAREAAPSKGVGFHSISVQSRLTGKQTLNGA